MKISNSENYFMPSLILVFYIIFSFYPIFGTFSNWSFLLTFIYCLFFIIFKRNEKLYFYKPLITLSFLVIIFYLINSIVMNDLGSVTLNNIINMAISLLFISIFTSRVNLNFIYRIGRVIGIITSFTLIVQSIGLFIFQIPAVPINILPLPQEFELAWGDFLGRRPSAFFSEPQAAASYLLPIIALSMYKKDIFVATFISIGILSSTSTLGTILVFFLFIYNGIISQNNRLIYTPIILVLGFLGLYFFNTLDFFEFSRYKILNVDFLSDARLSRGFILLSYFTFTELIIGIGNSIESFTIEHINADYVTNALNRGYDYNAYSALNYTTTVAGNFIKYGLLCGSYYIYMIFKLFNSSANILKTFIIIIIILSFSQTILFNSWFIYFFGIFFGLIKKPNPKDFYIINTSLR